MTRHLRSLHPRGGTPVGGHRHEKWKWTPPSHDSIAGSTNQNPAGMSLFELWAEDLCTHDGNLLDPGFWAVAVHRFGNWRMSIRQPLLRAPLTLIYDTAHRLVCWLWGLDLPYTVRLGRRVRLWHHGGMIFSARAIGDDVHLRHNTTMGVARRTEPWNKPVIGDRVDIGVGACILGNVEIGDDSVIGANAVVLESCPPGSVMVGVPARPVRRRRGTREEKRTAPRG